MTNKLLLRIALAVLVPLLVSCAAPPPPPVKPKQKIDRITLLPQADGSPSAVVVRSSGGEAVLAQPYATANVGTESVETSMSSAAVAGARYKGLYDAMPPPRSSYLVYFETGGDRLTPDSAQRLNEILSEIAKLPAPEVLVIGHTDTVGTDSINDEVSMQRARIVRTRLIEKGVDAKRIEAVGRGRRELLVPTRDGVAEPRNRRVEIQVR